MMFKQMNLMGFRGIKNSTYPFRHVVKFQGRIIPWKRLKVDLIVLDLLNDPPQTEPVFHPVLSQEQWDAKHWKELTEAHDAFLTRIQRFHPTYGTGGTPALCSNPDSHES